MSEFRNQLAETVFRNKYANSRAKDFTWKELSYLLVDDVCGSFQGTQEPLLPKDEREFLQKIIEAQQWIPGGRYLYYAGRKVHYWNNCFLLRAEEDTREEWSSLVHRSSSALMSGGGIGTDYSILREYGRPLSRTGGIASGPLGLMNMTNEVGRYVMQGGARRSAIYASLNWQHPDASSFLVAKNWQGMQIGNRTKEDGSPYTIWDAKQEDFNFHAPLDMTNISLNYDDAFLDQIKNGTLPETFVKNVHQALSTAEPGFSFNFGDKQNETLRNACTEVTSEDDSDVCNLGSINMANIETIEEFKQIVIAATRFLLCGTLRASLPYDKVYKIREKNRRLGLGLMGVHEWLLKRGYRYEVVPELHEWLRVYQEESDKASAELAGVLGVSRPVANRAIAPTGSIGILAGTTTSIEPLYAIAYKRRYLKAGQRWHYQYVIDSTAELLIEQLGLNPDQIETAANLASDYERRIKFQADVQDYVDMSISSTINLPSWGSELNNEDRVMDFANMLAKYAPRLRGFTCYADGCRGGQPITEIAYKDAVGKKGVEHAEHDICSITQHGGTCGI